MRGCRDARGGDFISNHTPSGPGARQPWGLGSEATNVHEVRTMWLRWGQVIKINTLTESVAWVHFLGITAVLK